MEISQPVTNHSKILPQNIKIPQLIFINQESIGRDKLIMKSAKLKKREKLSSSISESQQAVIPDEDKMSTYRTPAFQITKKIRGSKNPEKEKLKSSGKGKYDSRKFSKSSKTKKHAGGGSAHPQESTKDSNKREYLRHELNLLTERKKLIENLQIISNEEKKRRQEKKLKKKNRKDASFCLPFEQKRQKDSLTYTEKLKTLEQKNVFLNWFLMLSVVLSLNFTGYYIVICNVIAIPLTRDVYGLDEHHQKMRSGQFGAFLALGYLLSSLNMGLFSKHVGRVRTLLLMELLKIVVILLYRIQNIKLFIVLRLLTGIICGFQGIIVPLIGKEMMPPRVAVVGGAMFYSSRTLFMLVASLMHMVFGGEHGLSKHWRLVLTWPMIFCFVVLGAILSTLGIHETPDFYVENIKDEAKLREAITRSMKRIYTEESAVKFTQYKLEEIRKNQKNNENNKINVMGWGNMFSKVYRSQLILAILISMLKEFSGISFMVFFSTQVFNAVSGNGSTITVVLSVGNFLGAVLSLFVIGYGRRSGQIVSTVIHGIAIIGLYFGTVMKDGFLLSISTLVYIVSFACGLAAITGVYLVEILPPFGLGVTLAFQWLVAIGIGASSPYLIMTIGAPAIMVIHFLGCWLLFVTLYFLCHETKGLSKEEIQRIFMKGMIAVGKKTNENKKEKKKEREVKRVPGGGGLETERKIIETELADIEGKGPELQDKVSPKPNPPRQNDMVEAEICSKKSKSKGLLDAPSEPIMLTLKHLGLQELEMRTGRDQDMLNLARNKGEKNMSIEVYSSEMDSQRLGLLSRVPNGHNKKKEFDFSKKKESQEVRSEEFERKKENKDYIFSSRSQKNRANLSEK